MYTIVGKVINDNNQIVGYKICNGDKVGDFSIADVYAEYKKGNIPVIKDFNTNTGDISLNSIDDKLLPIFHNGICVNNSIAIIKVIKKYSSDTNISGAMITDLNGNLMTLKLSDVISIGKQHTLYNAKVVNNRLISKYGEFEISVTHALKDFETKIGRLVFEENWSKQQFTLM